jgi:hypothetical protein
LSRLAFEVYELCGRSADFHLSGTIHYYLNGALTLIGIAAAPHCCLTGNRLGGTRTTKNRNTKHR